MDHTARQAALSSDVDTAAGVIVIIEAQAASCTATSDRSDLLYAMNKATKPMVRLLTDFLILCANHGKILFVYAQKLMM